MTYKKYTWYEFSMYLFLKCLFLFTNNNIIIIFLFRFLGRNNCSRSLRLKRSIYNINVPKILITISSKCRVDETKLMENQCHFKQ